MLILQDPNCLGENMIKICYVCIGNTCRSVMAERLTKLELKKLGIKNIKISSRGIDARGDNITDNAKVVLKKMGASGVNRKSIKLGKLDKNTLYVTMTSAQKAYLGEGKIISMGDLIGHDVLDPYGQDEAVYEQTAKILQRGIKILLFKLREKQ